MMNIRRYSHSVNGAGSPDSKLGQNIYSPPKRNIQMNTDLFERPGQPPFSPFGVQVIRTANYLYEE